MILGAVDSDGNLIIKSSHTFGYDWFAGGSGGTAQDRYVSSQGTGESKSQPTIVGGSGCKGVM
jgi:hypothetical protein